MFTFVSTWILGLGCANSGLGRLDPPTGDTASFRCPYEGRWSLVDLTCGAFSLSEFFDRYDTAVLEVMSRDGACAIERSLSGITCTEVEAWELRIDPDDATAGTLADAGVVRCEPADCSFDGGVTRCMLEERLVSVPVMLALEGDRWTLTGGLSSVAEDVDCPLDLVATFTRDF